MTAATGDLNGDTMVNLTDAILALQIVAGIPIQTVLKTAAVNGDGKIGLEEVIFILQKVAGVRGGSSPGPGPGL